METPSRITQNVVRRARQLRTWRGMSAADLAAKMSELGLSTTRNTITNAENGRLRYLSIDQVLIMATALDVTIADLIYGPSACPNCGDDPNHGYRCMTCGRAG